MLTGLQAAGCDVCGGGQAGAYPVQVAGSGTLPGPAAGGTPSGRIACRG